MNLFSYLEYLTNQERQIASSQGQSNLSNKTYKKQKEIEYPEWFINTLDEMGVDVSQPEDIKYFFNNAKKLLSYNKIDTTEVVRVIILPNGNYYSASSNDLVHSEMIFSIFKNQLNLGEKILNTWYYHIESLKYFLAIEVYKKTWQLSESYYIDDEIKQSNLYKQTYLPIIEKII